MSSQLLEISEEMVRNTIPPRRRSSHKGENGRVLVVGGGRIFHGAPIFAALGAYRAGVDVVYVASPEKVSNAIRAFSPSLIVFPLPDVKLTEGCANIIVKNIEKGVLKVDSAVIGPGLSGSSRHIAFLAYKLSSLNIKLVLDAAALKKEIVEKISGRDVVLTPHEFEFYRMFGEKLEKELEKRAEVVKRYASEFQVTILLKGMMDVISDGRTVLINKTGSPGMTVGGTGDVLAGLIAGFMARGLRPLEAAFVGAYVNGLAGEAISKKKGFHFLTEELIEELPNVLKRFDKVID
ncbi:NAD(P)H-hydrate dehydratase [Candidatus Geothermarchaeota archaeon]|nr:MAG: NAD(P)H-hydrate dehydratase [Candidatus Geothermarchaeota archaeon]